MSCSSAIRFSFFIVKLNYYPLNNFEFIEYTSAAFYGACKDRKHNRFLGLHEKKQMILDEFYYTLLSIQIIYFFVIRDKVPSISCHFDCPTWILLATGRKVHFLFLHKINHFHSVERGFESLSRHGTMIRKGKYTVFQNGEYKNKRNWHNPCIIIQPFCYFSKITPFIETKTSRSILFRIQTNA